ncbi:putative SOS response-associated peptidase YedK [Rhizobium mongolense]
MDELLRMEPDRGVTNVRKLNLKHWRQWFGVEHRCIVPVTTFTEPDSTIRSWEGKSRMPGSGETKAKNL